jgi:hypothetical protein
MENYLKITVKKNNLILEGSINAEHLIDFDAKSIKIILSDGKEIYFNYSQNYDSWFLSANYAYARGKNPAIVKNSNEYGSSDEITINYAIKNVIVSVDGENIKFYGDPIVFSEHQNLFDKLIVFLVENEVTVTPEIEAKLRLLISSQTHFSV